MTDTNLLKQAREALLALLDRYTSLVNCGDCGNWNPENEQSVKAARSVVAAIDAQQAATVGADYEPALLAAWDAHRADKWADKVPHPTFCAGFRAAWDTRATPPAVQAPAEAVAWQWRRKGEPWSLDKTFNSQVYATTPDSEVRPLYAAPAAPAAAPAPAEPELPGLDWPALLLLINAYAMHVADAAQHQAASRADISHAAALKALAEIRMALAAHISRWQALAHELIYAAPAAPAGWQPAEAVELTTGETPGPWTEDEKARLHAVLDGVFGWSPRAAAPGAPQET